MNKSGKLVCGVGINDANYPVSKSEGGKIVWRCPYYRVWESMLGRAYSNSFKQRFPTYQDCTVCEEWLTFSNFKTWMESQNWEGKQLDKDILIHMNKQYSPNTCVFVDRIVNSFILDRTNGRGKWPLGVYWNKRFEKFVSSCSNPFTNKQEYLGLYTCPNQAHLAWKARKHELACQLADLQSDERVAAALKLRYR